MLRKLIMTTCLLIMVPLQAAADVALLIQGYYDNGSSWHRSGVGAVMSANGWRYGGQLFSSLNGVQSTLPQVNASRTFYTTDLPTEAPLMLQSDVLASYVTEVKKRHPGERIHLIGHSAGGVLARLYMVRNPDSGITTLVTIASPHLGTEVAWLGNAIGQSPLSWLAPWVGAATINRSQALYYDLNPEHPGNLVFWLNRQPHPKARYVSVVRTGGYWFIPNDIFVPSWSQDMNRVPALAGQSAVIPVSAEHGLQAADALVILGMLR